MSRKSELLEERQGVVGWFLETLLGRSTSTEDEKDRAVRRIGDINEKLEDEDD